MWLRCEASTLCHKNRGLYSRALLPLSLNKTHLYRWMRSLMCRKTDHVRNEMRTKILRTEVQKSGTLAFTQSGLLPKQCPPPHAVLVVYPNHQTFKFTTDTSKKKSVASLNPTTFNEIPQRPKRNCFLTFYTLLVQLWMVIIILSLV